MIFLYIKNQLAMMDKMVARVLLYAQGLLSYGNLRCAKLKIITKKIVLPSLRLVYGNRFFSDAAKNGTIFSRN